MTVTSRKFVIDVSNNNPATREQVRASRSVALICKATEGTNFRDATLAEHRKIATELKIPFGSYTFLHPGSSGNEAQYYLNYAKPKKGIDIEPVIDTEVADGETMAQVAARVDSCARYLEKKGYRPIIYASSSFWQELFAERPDLKRFRVWEAQYPGFFTRWFPGLATRRVKLRHGVTVVLWQWTDRYAAGGKYFDCSVLLAPLDSILTKGGS